MIRELTNYVFECDAFGCSYKSDVFEWQSEAMGEESAHNAEFHVPVFDDESVPA